MGMKRPRVSEDVMGRVETLVDERVGGATDYNFNQQLEALLTLVETTPTDTQSVREAKRARGVERGPEPERPDDWPSQYYWPPETPEGINEAVRRGHIETTGKVTQQTDDRRTQEDESVVPSELRSDTHGSPFR